MIKTNVAALFMLLLHWGITRSLGPFKMPIRVDILDHNQLVANLKNPVEGSLPVENIEPVVRGEPDEPIGEDMPVSDSDPGDLTEEM